VLSESAYYCQQTDDNKVNADYIGNYPGPHKDYNTDNKGDDTGDKSANAQPGYTKPTKSHVFPPFTIGKSVVDRSYNSLLSI
jgi:hypothetical protein